MGWSVRMFMGRRTLASSLVMISAAGLLLLLPTILSPNHQVSAANTSNPSQVHRVFRLNGTVIPIASWNSTGPSPRLTVNTGDLVTLMLKSGDGILHEWYIDFNNNMQLDSNETFFSTGFRSTTSYSNYTFTPVIGVNVTKAGTFPYRCAFHPTMLGSITINGPPLSASFTVSPPSLMPGQTATFSAAVTGGTPSYSFSWNFGDGTTNSTMQSPTHSYGSPGTYTVELAVADSGSPRQISTSTMSVLVSSLPPPPTITLTRLSPNPAFPGEPVLIDFTATYSNGPVTATWIDWGDHSTPELLLNVTSSSMCPKLMPGSQSTQCAIAPGDVILAQPQDPSTIVNGSIIVFSSPQSPDFLIIHRVVGIMPPTTNNPEYSFKTQGDANALYDCFPSTPFCYFPASWILGVYQSTQTPPLTLVCIPENPCPTGGPGARYDYHTYVNLGSSKTQTYTVRVNATDFDGTHAEITTVETVKDRSPLINDLSVSPSTIMAGSTTTLTFQAKDPDGTVSSITISWGDGTTTSNLLGTTTSQTHKYTTAGTFTISVFATDNSGSTNPAATSAVTVNPQPSPSAPAPRILGLDATLFYVLAAVGVGAVATATIIALRTRRPQA